MEFVGEITELESMIPPFDIFYTDADGHLIWCGTASSLEDAKQKANSAIRAGSYQEMVIFSQRTGNRLVVKADASDNSSI
jgi:hypothetical protein